MSSQKFMVPRTVPVPRGAQWAAEIAAPVFDRLAWKSLAARFTAAVRRLAAMPPAPADEAPEDRAREAAATREMAYRYLSTDRGFAADLLAAADRHERGGQR